MVVLPFVPVTNATGTSWTAPQSTSSGAGSASTRQVREPAPSPTDASSSSERNATPRSRAAAWSARSGAFRSRPMVRASAAVSSSGSTSPPITRRASSKACSLTSVAA